MQEIKEKLFKVDEYCDWIIKEAESDLEKKNPTGNLRVVNNRGNKEYYLCVKNGDTNGKYISKQNIHVAYDIAQRDYELKIIRNANQWKKWVSRCLRTMPGSEIKDVHMFYKNRQELIVPYELDDVEYVDAWMSAQYKGKQFEEDYYEIITEKGERVRSKSEKIIADKLYMMNIPYRYEFPLELKYPNYRVIYPDFVILNVRERKEYILEHFGMMDCAEYCENAIRKMNLYMKNGYIPGVSIIYTYETSQTPIDIQAINRLLAEYFL